MKLTWLGHSCMELQYGEYSVVLDPFSPGYVPGLADISASADMVLCSHQHGDHNYAQGITIKKHLDFPLKISSVPTYHDNRGGKDRGPNTVHIIDFPDGQRAVHLGDLGHLLDNGQLSVIGTPDVLMIPVGGFYTIDAVTAKQVCDLINPRVIIPMHYRGDTFGFDVIAKVDDFTSLFPAEKIRRYSVNTIDITPDTPSQVAVLRYIK